MKRRGSIVLSLLVVLMLSMLISGLLQSSLFHLKVYRARYRHRVSVEQIKGDVYHCLHDLKPRMLQSSGGFEGLEFPGESRRETRISGRYNEKLLADKGSWKKTRIYCLLSANRSTVPYKVAAMASVDRLTGDIPLVEFELLDLEKERNKKKPGIDFVQGMEAESVGVELHLDVDGFLKERLSINGSGEPWAEIRRMAGLEALDQPIPEGFYFLVREGFIPALWIQGDVDEMVLSGGNDSQRIFISRGGTGIELMYTPNEKNLIASGYPEIDGCGFQEMIVVNGSIYSLRQKNPFAFHPLSGLLLLAAGSVRIESSLVSPIQERLPSWNHLVLIVSRKRFFSDETVKAEVVIDSLNQCALHVGLLVQGEIAVVAPLLHLEGIAVAERISGNGFAGIRPVFPKLSADGYFFSRGIELKKNFLIQSLYEASYEE